MAATRLSEAQKIELVDRFRGGASSQELADQYGCSANTVSRVVKQALDPDEYERLKGRRGRRGGTAAAAEAPQLELPQPAAGEPEAPAPEAPPLAARAVEESVLEAPDLSEPELEDPELDAEDRPSSWAIDDADDFGDDSEDTSEDDGPEEDGLEEADSQADLFVVVPLAGTSVDDGAPALEARPLEEAVLPGSVFMLVDKTVELEVKPLRDFSDLPPLAEEEQERQALMVYANSRNAKRQCGRTQRVIKVPDTDVFRRTAPYLVRKGITRLVVDGALYSLPGC
ncbi:MAG: hypothetical protein VKK62_11650 [Synechococcaceae cyanobacterium]|nr:hypothetical protein [Synechococcaceae cyanobacterium]